MDTPKGLNAPDHRTPLKVNNREHKVTYQWDFYIHKGFNKFFGNKQLPKYRT